ncbi:Nipped-B-like protein B [Symbiodinium microadriaticum]|uniref:Nipped-B-like protein B n=1 Tax=Symbiodinium microadriaticum TaxID=2951 RepID=A0A1Q9D4B1_SYMMI|nr:Nipped-B-like protein B [Symbiodinium microadriaticum]
MGVGKAPQELELTSIYGRTLQELPPQAERGINRFYEAQCTKYLRERERLQRVGCLKKPSARWNKQELYLNSERLATAKDASRQHLLRHPQLVSGHQRLQQEELLELLAMQHFLWIDLADLDEDPAARCSEDRFTGPENSVCEQLLLDAPRELFVIDGVEYDFASTVRGQSDVNGNDLELMKSDFCDRVVSAISRCLGAQRKQLMRAVTSALSQSGLAHLEAASAALQVAVSGGEQDVRFELRSLSADGPWEVELYVRKANFHQCIVYESPSGSMPEAAESAESSPRTCSPSSFFTKSCRIRFSETGADTVMLDVLSLHHEHHLIDASGQPLLSSGFPVWSAKAPNLAPSHWQWLAPNGLAGVGKPTSPPRARESPAAPARYAAVESYSEEDDVEAEAAEGDADGRDDEDEEQEEDDDDEESSSSPEKLPSPRSRRKDKKEEEEHRRRQDAAAAAAAKAAESKKAQKVVQAANRSDWQRIRQLRATSKVQKTPFFDVEMNAALACGQYKAGTALYEQLCKLKLPKEVLTFNLATKLYGKAGMWASVRQVWKEARKSYRMDETMAAARLVAAADEGDIRTAADILDEMVRMDLVVDVGHFTSALRACATAENSGHHAAVYLFDTLLNMSLTPDVQVFTALVSTFAGRPVSKFQKLRSQMDQFGVKHNWVFADAYLKALLVVPQKDKQSSVVELVDLMRGLSKERLREAASALSSFKTLKDEWSAFCEVTEKSSKTATAKQPRSEQSDSHRKVEEKSRNREVREKPRRSEASQAEERMKEKQREAREQEMQEKEHEQAKTRKKKKGREPEPKNEGSRRDASAAMQRSREKAPSTATDEAQREGRRKEKASRDDKTRRKEEKEAADREASRRQEEARAAKQKEKERDEVKKREEEERRERARKEEEQRRREQEKEEERRREKEREEERRREKEREEEKQREKQRLEEELRRERERREREEEKRREKERAEREEREERERRREQEREEERRREKERQEREEKRREEERREKEREQKRREKEREEERRREKDREEERRREKDREEERRREKDRDDDRRRDRDREDERRRESGRDDRRRDKDREDDRRRDKDRENEHRRDRDRHEERDRHEKDRDKDRDKDKYREKDRGRERERSRDRDDRERERDRDREKDTGRDRDRSKPREKERSKQRERSRPRDRERDRDDRDRNRHDNERDTRNKDRAKERERERERDKDRARERERERDRDRDADDRRKKDGQRHENGSKKARSVTPLPGRTQPPPASDADGAAFPPPLPTSDRKGGQYDPERLPSSSPAPAVGPGRQDGSALTFAKPTPRTSTTGAPRRPILKLSSDSASSEDQDSFQKSVRYLRPGNCDRYLYASAPALSASRLRNCDRPAYCRGIPGMAMMTSLAMNFLRARGAPVMALWPRHSSSLRVASCDLQRGSVFLQKGIYCEVRSSKPAGHGRSADGAYEIRYRELRTRKAREMKMKETETLQVVECERVSMPVMYKDDTRLVLADSDYNEVEVAMEQLGEAGEVLQCGHAVSVLYHEGNLVKVVPPPQIADQLQQDFRKQRRAKLASRQKERKELREKRAHMAEDKDDKAKDDKKPPPKRKRKGSDSDEQSGQRVSRLSRHTRVRASCMQEVRNTALLRMLVCNQVHSGIPFQMSSSGMAEAAHIAVRIKAHTKIGYGEDLLVCGSAPALGSWNLADAALMQCKGDLWTLTTELPCGVRDVSKHWSICTRTQKIMDQCKYDFEEEAARPINVAIGFILVMGTAISIIPAHVKIWSKRSCEGVSQATILLTNAAYTCLAWNMMMLKFPQIESCRLNWWLCQANLLAFYQVLVQWLLFFPLYSWCTHFGEEGQKRWSRKAWLAQVGMLLCGTGGLILWSLLSDCSWTIRLVASGLGYISAFLNGVRQIPQIRTSLSVKGSGSVSYTFYGLMGLGGILNLYFQIDGSKERLTTVLSTAVGCAMQRIKKALGQGLRPRAILAVALVVAALERSVVLPQGGPGYSKSSGKNGWKLGREADLEVPEAGGLTQALQTSLNGTRKAEQRVIALTAALGKREELWSQYERDIAAAYKKEHARFLRDMARIRDDLQKATVVQAESRQELVRVFYTGGAVQPFLWDRLS